MSRSATTEAPAAGRRKENSADFSEYGPVRKEIWMPVVGIAALVGFYFTSFRTPGLLVWVHYALGIAGSLVLSYLLAQVVPISVRARWIAAGVVTGCAVFLWAHYDHYEHRWKNPDGDRYSDWVHRWSGKVSHRTLALKNHSISQLAGPMSGATEQPHGRWRETREKPYPKTSDVWYWHGKRIAKEDWDQQNRRL